MSRRVTRAATLHANRELVHSAVAAYERHAGNSTTEVVSFCARLSPAGTDQGMQSTSQSTGRATNWNILSIVQGGRMSSGSSPFDPAMGVQHYTLQPPHVLSWALNEAQHYKFVRGWVSRVYD